MKNLLSLILLLSSVAIAENQNKEIYIVKFQQQGLVHYTGGIAGLKATSPAITGTKKPNLTSVDSKAYLGYLKQQQQQYKALIAQRLNRDIGKTLDYYYTNLGMAVYFTASEAGNIKSIDGVMSVTKDVVYQLATDAGPTFIGAAKLWDGSASLGNTPNQGEGVIVGVIDTGLNMDHVSFSDIAEDGYDFATANPFGAGNFVGACDGVTFICNNKYIGAWDFVEAFPPGGESENDGPEDSNGHGTHTASTAVGNKLTAPLGGFTGLNGVLDAPFISGVAPHAHLISYDVCIDSCSGAAINAAINQAIADGVDVLSFSISGGLNPWNDLNRVFLDAVNAGIVVSTAAGNTSAATPNPVGQVNHRGPWLLSVANSTHSRAFGNEISITAPNPVPENLTGLFGTNSSTDNFTADVAADLIYAGNVDAGNEDGCNAFSNNTSFTGKIALIARGTCDFAVKVNNAQAAGAIATLVHNNIEGPNAIMSGMESTTIPAVFFSLLDGSAVISFIQSVNAGDVQAFLAQNIVHMLVDTLGDILNSSSFIGPNNSFDVTKPDINGPGTDIFAAYADSGVPPAEQFARISGTSMSAPHIAGAAALIVAAHPTWSPSEIQSVMMMTAKNNGKRGNGSDTNADDVGSGTVDLSKAALSPLVMDETFANYLAANPFTIGNGDPATLNIPSLRANDCNGQCSWTRTLTNKSNVTETWSTAAYRYEN
ncbi:hypothetical protein MNBD_GAMMA01-1415, partial [hydrothermal vent metagenome]